MPNQRPIRVLFWCPIGAGDHYNGPGSFFYRLFSTAPPGTYEVTLVHGWPEQKVYPFFKAQHLIHPYNGGKLSTILFLRKGQAWMRQHAREFDVVLGTSAYHTTVLPCYRAHQQGVPVVTFIANQLTELGDKSGWKGWLGLSKKRRKLLAQMPATVAMSRAIYDELKSYGFPDSIIARIPMGINTERFAPVDDATRSALRKSHGWADKPTLIFCGGLNTRKRPHLLIEAVGLLKQRSIELPLVLVGPEDEAEYCASMRARCAELGITELVRLHGFTRDPAPLYQASDFFGLPSTNEGMPAALVEAMGTGLVPLVTDVSGARDLVNDGHNGRIISGDAKEIADILQKYLADPALTRQHAQAARAQVEAKFSARSVEQAYRDLFDRLIAQAQGRKP
jgi:glycosyltransferase involved in cell wall biosynthesis